MGKVATADSPLSPLQQRFVEAMLSNGGNGTQAVIAAGSSTKYPASYASQLLRKPHVRKALQLEAVETLRTRMLIKALAQMDKLIEADSESVAFHASKDVMDRAGFRAPERSDVQVQGEIRIDLRAPVVELGDGTHGLSIDERGAGLKLALPPIPTPQAPTVDTENVTDLDEVDTTTK
jgi:hypothetical protein